MTVFLPTPGQALVDPRTGHFTSTYRRWANALTEAVNAAQGGTIIVPPDPVSFVVSGAGSVTADGSVAGGEFVVTLEGDKDSPPPNSFYGATTAGDKGFVPVYDALVEGTGIAIRDSGYIVIDTVETPDDLPLTGNAGEAVRVTGAEPGLYAWDGAAFTIDTAADGTVTVTCDATAAEITYDNTTSGLSATNVQGAVDELKTLIVAGAWTMLTKASDETRNSTTTLADDGALVLALAATTRYHIKARIFYSIANATMDFKYRLAYSGTTTSQAWHNLVRPAGITASGTDDEFTLTGASAFPLPTFTPGSAASGIGYIDLQLTLLTNAAGTLSLQWAQNTSDAGDCKVLAGSCFEYIAA